MAKPYRRELRVAIRAARAAGSMLMRHYGKRPRVRYKAGYDMVTAIDLQSERAVLAVIRAQFPTHSIVSEEAGSQERQSPYVWYIDPLDGTTNYAVQNPLFNVSIALNYLGQTIVGVVFNPYTRELFTAIRGGGAYLNGKRISCSSRSVLAKAFVAFCFGMRKRSYIQRTARLYTRLKPRIKHLRQMGSAALELCYVAAGRIEAFWMVYFNPYDVAAGVLIAQEAGCRATDFAGKPFRTAARHVLVANPKIHPKLLRQLRRF